MSDSTNLKSWGLTILRVVVGLVFFMHGQQKLFTFGLHGVQGMMGSLGIPLPGISAAILIAVEFIGGILLIAGLLTRYAAALNAIDMVVAILFVHLKNGFFLPMGFEFALTMLAASVALALAGPGAAAVDNVLGKRA
jgi:putative oxidoreductase